MVITKTQAAAGGGGGAIIIGSGALGAKLLLSLGPMPEYTVLALESDFSTTYSSSGTIGKKNSWYLVGTYGENNKNKDFWEWSYKKWRILTRQEIGAHLGTNGKFADHSKIKSAFAEKNSNYADADKALNRICESFYKATDFSDYSNNEDESLIVFCSPLGKTPSKLSETEGETNTDIQNLISTKDSKNYEFWKLRNAEFFGKPSENGIGNGLTSSEDSLFHTLYSNKGQDNVGNVKDTCEQAYSLIKNNESSGKVKTETAKKFCNWKLEKSESS